MNKSNSEEKFIEVEDIEVTSWGFSTCGNYNL